MVSVAASGAERAGGRAASLRARMERKPGAPGGIGARPSDPILCRAGRGVGAGLRAAGFGLFAMGMDKLRAVFISAQPGAALSGLFLRRLRGRRLWPRPRAARQRWRAGAALGRLARRLGRGLCAVGAADVADGGWPPGAAPRADRRGARFRRWPARRAASSCWRCAFVSPRNGREFSTVFRSMPTACISCTTSSSSGCNTRCCPSALFAIGKAAIVFGGTLALSWAAAVAFGNVSWANHLAQAKRWMRASFSDPAPAKLVKQDDLTG